MLMCVKDLFKRKEKSEKKNKRKEFISFTNEEVSTVWKIQIFLFGWLF